MRKRNWMVVTLLVAVLAVAFGVSPAFAHGTPTAVDGEEWHTEGYCHGAGGMMGGGMMGGYHTGLTDPVTLERVAGILGLTYEQLTARLTQGETIAQIAQAQGVDSSLVVTTILAPQSEILQVRVKYGYLTETQAQAILQQTRYWVEQTIVTPHYGYYGPATTPATGYIQPYAPNYGWRSRGGGQGGMMGGGAMGGGMMGGW